MRTRKPACLDDLDFDKGGGLIPVVVQDSESLKVLSLAYTDREALERTVETGYAHFFRRSFGKVMKKGATSGNVQEIRDILVDCDRDAIVYLIKPAGPACHLGKETCFHNKLREE